MFKMPSVREVVSIVTVIALLIFALNVPVNPAPSAIVPLCQLPVLLQFPELVEVHEPFAACAELLAMSTIMAMVIAIRIALMRFCIGVA